MIKKGAICQLCFNFLLPKGFTAIQTMYELYSPTSSRMPHVRACGRRRHRAVRSQPSQMAWKSLHSAPLGCSKTYPFLEAALTNLLW